MQDSKASVHREQVACRLCTANCGLVVSVDSQGLLSVEGDRTHPISGGYTCSKGRSIPDWHASPSRVNHPRIHGEQVGWDMMVKDLAGGFHRLIEASGPNAIGYYGGTGGYWDTMGWAAMARFHEKLGSEQKYTAATVDVAPAYRAAELVTGHASLQPWWAPERSGPRVLLLFGTNPAVAHGYIGATMANPIKRLRDFRQAGGTIWAFDPRVTKTTMASSHHVRLKPGSDVYILAHLIRELLSDGCDQGELARHCSPEDVQRLRNAVARFDAPLVEAHTGASLKDLDRLVADIRGAGKIAALTGTGLTFAPAGLLADWLRWALLIITGSLDTAGGMYFNASTLSPMEARAWTDPAPAEGRALPGAKSRPDLPVFFGERPAAAIVDEIESGNLRSLLVFGGNPLTCLPNPDRVDRALSKLDMLVVVDPFENELTARASHVLPSAWILERSDVRQMADRLQYSPALVPLGFERKPGWWMFGSIAEAMGMDLFGDGVAMADRTEDDVLRAFCAGMRGNPEALIAAGSHGLPTPEITGWVHEQALPCGKWRLAPKVLADRLDQLASIKPGGPVLVTGRIPNATNSVLFARQRDRLGEQVAIHLAPDVAAAHALVEGHAIEISSGRGSLSGMFAIDANLAPGTVWINHGWSRCNVNGLIGDADIDPLTTQPIMSAIPVEVRMAAP